MFAVVEFPATDCTPSSVEVVPFIWLSDDQKDVRWPPKQMSVKRAIDKFSTPTSIWGSFPVIVKFVSGDRKLANEKMSFLMEHSSLEELDNSIPARQVATTAIQESPITSSSDEEETDKTRKKGPAYLPNPPSIDYKRKPSPSTHRSATTSTINGSQGARLSLVGDLDSLHLDQISIPVTVPTETPKALESIYSGGFQRVVLRKLGEIQQELKDIRKQIKGIERGSAALTEESGCGDGDIRRLPLRTAQELTDFEAELANMNIKSSAIRLLKDSGDATAKKTTDRVLSKLLDDEVSIVFNWAGINRNQENLEKMAKRPFKVFTNILGLIFVVVRAVNPGATEKEVEGFVKDWLKYAPVRKARKDAVATKV